MKKYNVKDYLLENLLETSSQKPITKSIGDTRYKFYHKNGYIIIVVDTDGELQKYVADHGGNFGHDFNALNIRMKSDDRNEFRKLVNNWWNKFLKSTGRGKVRRKQTDWEKYKV